MDQDRLDQIFKDSLYDHKTQIDKDQLWAAINTKKRRRGWATSIKLLSAVLIIAAGAWVLSNKTIDTKSTKSVEQISNSLSTILDSDNKIAPTQSPSLKNEVVSSAQKTTTVTQQKTREAKSTVTVSSDLKNQTNFNKTTVTAEPAKTSVIRTINTEVNSESSREVILDKTTAKVVEQEVNQLNSANKTEFAKQTIASPVQEKTVLAYEAISTIQKLNSSQTLTAITSSAATPAASTLLKQNNKVECYDHRKKVPPFYAEIYSSVDYVTNRFSAEPENLNYKEERDESQIQLEGYRAGLRLKYLTRSGLYFKAGVEVSAIRERFERKETFERTEIRPNQLLEIITKSDTTIYIYGDAPVTIEENKIWKVWNTYRTVGIPALIGYQTEVGKFTCGLELGGIYNLHYDFEGMLLDVNLMPVAKPDYFKSRISSSLTGGLNVGYNLSERMSIMAYTSFKHNLSNINQSSNKVQQANSRIGLGLGLQFQL